MKFARWRSALSNFFFVSEKNETYVCIEQKTIMIFVTILTTIFQILMNRKFELLFHFLLFQKKNLCHQTNIKITNNIRQMLNVLNKTFRKNMFNSTKKQKSTRHHLIFSNFDDYVFKFKDQILRVEHLIVWISQNEYEFNDEKILYIRSKYLHIWIINKNVNIDDKYNIKIRQFLFLSLFRIIAKQIWRNAFDCEIQIFNLSNQAYK